MRNYVIVTGIIFALLTGAHIVRAIMEPSSLKDPVFMIFSLLAVGMALWAWKSLRQAKDADKAP
jgi:hypothetical protein